MPGEVCQGFVGFACKAEVLLAGVDLVELRGDYVCWALKAALYPFGLFYAVEAEYVPTSYLVHVEYVLSFATISTILHLLDPVKLT